ncbi:P-loop containing nucleoside triphosphate hydrolase protein [Desarmillaria tabescens]|uniref:Signal recognition particle receptor subunit beta n=1 Tax=Armillaria tabescens TaxID=1929756 RepID=A0AA39KGZ2_ARMTA|nr:P-loop containing nucleoside triphosphate hydrolase protein [Desarmillaria tabescens]KAK0459810.1 P-loop containing nucleoside triphosphate hydrolase protein [Desarmillaria tabescens]
MGVLQVLTRILIGLFVFLVAIIILTHVFKTRGNVVLLVGPSDAGKTAIFSKIMYDQSLPSHTSLQANTSSVDWPPFKKPVVIVDIPGHPKMRDQFKEHMKETIVVAFVVDASTVSRNAAAVAEHLHIIMDAIVKLPSTQKTPSLVIVAHKTDLLKNVAGSANASSNALAINRVRTVLERELEKRRAAHSDSLGVEGLGEEKTELGGLECADTAKTFNFSDWEGTKVHFIATSVKESAKDVDDEKSGPQIGLGSLRELLVTMQQ